MIHPLGELQEIFLDLFGQHIIWIAAQPGYTVRAGELYRPPELVAIYAVRGIGSPSSLHPDRLAGDLMIFKNGIYLTASEDYRFAGEHWKSLHELCRWGGDFRNRPDGDHFSITYQGRA